MNTIINIGTQIEAPQGYGSLQCGVRYHFLGNAGGDHVHLVEFAERPPKVITKRTMGQARKVSSSQLPRPYLHSLPREEFESAMGRSLLNVAPEQKLLPPWQEGLSGRSPQSLECGRRSRRKSHAERVERQLSVLKPLVEQWREILALENPDLRINSYARACRPAQNETRVRLGFYLYLAFGGNPMAFHFAVHRLGHWDRQTNPSVVKRGRPSINYGKNHGYNTTADLAEKIVRWYQDHRGPGVEITEMYAKFMVDALGCKIRERMGQPAQYFHPRGLPFPSLDTFRYYVQKAFPKRDRQHVAEGHQRARNKFDAYAGSFSERVCNVLEVVEQDAYSVKDLPVGLLDQKVLPALRVVHSVDARSGLELGIGASLGGEDAEAYLMEKFCRAIDKVKFCALFGIKIKPWQWPSVGLAIRDIQDRGPGAVNAAFARAARARTPIVELTPTHAGQSKPMVESSNPKLRSRGDGPHYRVSNLTVFELMQREIRRLLRRNKQKNVSRLVTPDLMDAIEVPNPINLYTELVRRGRNESHVMPFDDAVRAFLPKVRVKPTREGIKLFGSFFNSPALRASGLLQRDEPASGMLQFVYVLPLCGRHIWLDTPAGLLELEIQFAAAVGDDVKYFSLRDLKAREQLEKARGRAMKEHKLAVASESYREGRVHYGARSIEATRKVGRPKRSTEASRQEYRESKAAMRGEVAR